MVPVAAPMISTDTSPASSLAVCHPDRGGCGWRSPVFRTRNKALASAAAHRLEAHPELAPEAERAGRRHRAQSEGVAA
jgi:hypothetical protein